jgi:hypothetical protein
MKMTEVKFANVYTRLTPKQSLSVKDFEKWSPLQRERFSKLCSKYGLWKFNFSHVTIERTSEDKVTMTDVWAQLSSKPSSVVIPINDFRMLAQCCFYVDGVLSGQTSRENISRVIEIN